MGKFTVYNIPLKGLSEGIHSFDFLLDKKYFSDISDGESDIKRGDVPVKLTVKRVGSTFEMSFDLSGEVIVPCDRCLDDLSYEVAVQNRLFVKFGKEYSEESDEIVVIPEDEGEINIAWFLYEFVALSLPVKKVHPPGKCNRMMSSKLNKHKASSPDDESGDEDSDVDVDYEDDSSGDVDPRWDALKNLNTEE
ncbi:DUF177 domain-containing protein [Dysgonomonas sp. 520]|uniref:YceD family protein n=1 Tax=Dysgonomonas sp. 520 TaxID=2302931 RepID=UPI0013D7864F|nr:DUF177 domain-containing protein [Dysgonomonas sp. 520]